MEPVSPEVLLDQVREAVALLAATSVEQEAWAARTGFPVDEIVLQLADMVPGWFPRLREHHLLNESQEEELLSLRDYLGSVPSETLIVHYTIEKDGEAWEGVRRRAGAVLQRIA